MNKILFKLIEGKGKFFLNGDLVNGEIVNPEVLPINNDSKFGFSLQDRTGYLKDGDTFDLPEGMGFEEVKYSCNHVRKPNEIECIKSAYAFPDCCGDKKKLIRLLPEKPMNYDVHEHVKNAMDLFKMASEECSKRLIVNSEKPELKEESQEYQASDEDRERLNDLIVTGELAYKKGFNEAIDEVIKLSLRADIHPTKFFEEIEKLKK
jgi:hypothetical protein